MGNLRIHMLIIGNRLYQTYMQQNPNRNSLNKNDALEGNIIIFCSFYINAINSNVSAFRSNT